MENVHTATVPSPQRTSPTTGIIPSISRLQTRSTTDATPRNSSSREVSLETDIRGRLSSTRTDHLLQLPLTIIPLHKSIPSLNVPSRQLSGQRLDIIGKVASSPFLRVEADKTLSKPVMDFASLHLEYRAQHVPEAGRHVSNCHDDESLLRCVVVGNRDLWYVLHVLHDPLRAMSQRPRGFSVRVVDININSRIDIHRLRVPAQLIEIPLRRRISHCGNATPRYWSSIVVSQVYKASYFGVMM